MYCLRILLMAGFQTHLLNQKNSSINTEDFLVELAGIEPASESKNKITLAILLRSVVLIKG